MNQQIYEYIKNVVLNVLSTYKEKTNPLESIQKTEVKVLMDQYDNHNESPKSKQ